jgi:hypothetical protein
LTLEIIGFLKKIGDIGRLMVEEITVSDWILVTVVISAFLAPYIIERWKYRFYRPKLLLL